MPYKATLIPGDGIGPEITQATVRVLEATGVAFDWEAQEVGEVALARYGKPLPDHVLDSVRRNGLALKGPITTPVGTGFRSVNVALRKELDLYANLRPARTFLGVRTRYENVDLVVVRENTEDLYAGIELERGTPGMAHLRDLVAEVCGGVTIPDDANVSLKAISVHGSWRIVKFAFEYARANGRRKVSAVHKANIMKLSDGLFLEVARAVATEYPDIVFEDVIVDNMCMHLVQRPEEYDVLVLTNLYGDIVSDICAGLVGGLGMAPGGNFGEGMAVFEPVHGSAPRLAGQNKANPTAMMLSAVMMLRHLGQQEAARRMESAVAAVIAEGKDVTYDLKPQRDDPTAVGTVQMADAVIRKLG